MLNGAKIKERLKKKRQPVYRQLDAMDCGPTCLQMVTAYHGRWQSLQSVREKCGITKGGVSLEGLRDGANGLGFKAIVGELNKNVLASRVPLPCILHWNANHYVVLYDINSKYALVADPAIGKYKVKAIDFLKKWEILGKKEVGWALLLEPTDRFWQLPEEKELQFGLTELVKPLVQFRKALSYLIITLLVASLATLLVPFMMQAVVDKAIKQHSTSFLLLILIGQVVLVVARLFADLFRARLLFFLGSELNIRVLRDFLSKLMRLPMSFFDSRSVGDSIQRMMDHHKVEDFLTTSLVNFCMAAVSVVVFGGILAYYSPWLLLIFCLGAMSSLAWSVFYNQRRRQLDHEVFAKGAKSQNLLVETIGAVQEIKLTGNSDYKLYQWSDLQKSLFRAKSELLMLDQRMTLGSQVINEVKNIAIVFFAASGVMSGHFSLGVMLSSLFISGQLNQPILQIAELIRKGDLARFSLRRMHEVYQERNEDDDLDRRLVRADDRLDLQLVDIGFRYGGKNAPKLFYGLRLTFPAGKVTAIVGLSGSGKTTVIKLMLKLLRPQEGQIFLGPYTLGQIHAEDWRALCGTVMQDGFIFSDTIANNICAGRQLRNNELVEAARAACIHTFVEQLPLGYHTVIGKDGLGLSEGQVQRILIARLFYRKPRYIFLDEATNSLDAINEREVMQNLNRFFKGRTAVIVAHRLSTVRHADQIVVLEKGKVVETGTHEQLIAAQGAYYKLIENQLELGK